MPVNIQGFERPISKVFCSDFEFFIPHYQRPYAWTAEEAYSLYDDLLQFMREQKDDEGNAAYFLGSIVLIKGAAPAAKVVDGQQRLTTLTILLAVLRATMSDSKAKGNFTNYLYEEGNVLEKTKNRYRLHVRQRDNDFFEKYIQSENGIKQLLEANHKDFTDIQKRMLENVKRFNQELLQLEEKERLRFASFLLQQCHLVIVTTPDENSAFRIFSVLNTRGQDLLNADIIKAEVIGKLPAQQQEEYAHRWEAAEELLGRRTFDELISHIRTIHRKFKQQKALLDEIREAVKPAENPIAFIDNELTPLANAFSVIRNKSYSSSNGAENINQLFGWLNQIEHYDWIPPALVFFSSHQNDSAILNRFFADLERLAVYLMVMRIINNQRVERYGRITKAIENGDDLFQENSPLQLSLEEQNKLRLNLDSNIYEMLSEVRQYILLRLDSYLADSVAVYQHKRVTVEHVLPQKPKANSEWLKWYPDEDARLSWTHKLANLVLLTRVKNSQAQTYHFAEKKQKYFNGKDATPFVLTSQVLATADWTPAVLEKRQQRLIKNLDEIWRLNVNV